MCPASCAVTSSIAVGDQADPLVLSETRLTPLVLSETRLTPLVLVVSGAELKSMYVTRLSIAALKLWAVSCPLQTGPVLPVPTALWEIR